MKEDNIKPYTRAEDYKPHPIEISKRQDNTHVILIKEETKNYLSYCIRIQV